MNRDLSPPSSVRPTYVRYGVLAFACSLSMITYLDRASIGVAATDIGGAYGFKDISDLTWALVAFNLAYALFEVPTGWLGDVFGPRKTLIRIVLWWSVFTALTGLAGITRGDGVVLVPFAALVAIRFLFGIGEAGAYPNITRALHNWFPPQERGLTQGSVWMSGRLVGGLTPIIWTFLVVNGGMSWRVAFWLFGGLGVAWCVLFIFRFRNRPEDKPSVNEAELELIRAGVGHEADKAAAAVPWGRLFRSRTLWALCLMYFCMSYGWYFNLSYLPTYLKQQHGVLDTSWVGSLYKGGPLIFGAVGCLLGGYLTDLYIRRTGNRRWGRRLLGMFGHALCVPLYLACLIAPSAFTFALAIALTGFFNDLAMGSAWAACQDVGKKHAAIVAGCMNTIGNLGGAAATWLTGTILGLSRDAYAQAHGLNLDALKADPAQASALKEALKNGLLPGYQINFIIFAVVYAIAVFLWLGIDATKPVLPEDAADTGVRAG
jgi:ACS family glucarate transporter-like MFS transporter